MTVTNPLHPRKTRLMQARLVAVATAACLGLATPVHAKPTRAALDHVRSLAASRAGVDKSDQFWAWNAVEANVSLISPRGELRTLEIDTDVKALDVDTTRGLVVLGADSTSVRVIGWDGKVTSRFKLSATANGISWLDGDRIAVTPERTSSLVEIWSASTQSRIRTVGEVPPITVPARGAVLNRATLVQFNDQRQELAVFDAFYGNLTVFDSNGRALRTAQITHPRLGANMAWLKDLDQNAKAQGESSTPTFYNYARISMSRDGVIWLGEDGPTAESITLAKILPNGKVERKTVSVPECASVRYEIWQDQLVFFREPKSPRKQCTAVKEVPR
jgi:hypothetical protein